MMKATNLTADQRLVIIKEIKAFCKDKQLSGLERFLFADLDEERVRSRYTCCKRKELYGLIYKLFDYPNFDGKEDILSLVLCEEITRQCEDEAAPIPHIVIGRASSPSIQKVKCLNNLAGYNLAQNTIFVSLEPFLSDFYIRGEHKEELTVVKKLEILNNIVPKYTNQLCSKKLIHGDYLGGKDVFIGASLLLEQIELFSTAKSGDIERMNESTQNASISPSFADEKREALVKTKEMLIDIDKFNGKDLKSYNNLRAQFIENNTQLQIKICKSVKDFRYKLFYNGLSNIFAQNNTYSTLACALDNNAYDYFSSLGMVRKEPTLDAYDDVMEKYLNVNVNESGELYASNSEVDRYCILGLEDLDRRITIADDTISIGAFNIKSDDPSE